MAALAQDIVRPYWSLPEVAPNDIHTQKQNTIIYQGAVAVQVAGKAQPAASGVVGQTILGIAIKHTEAGGADVVYADPDALVFHRGAFYFDMLADDLPTEALVGKPVYFADDNTVKATAAANDVSGTLRKIVDGQAVVEI